jgi:phenylalanine ammonia-lyase
MVSTLNPVGQMFPPTPNPEPAETLASGNGVPKPTTPEVGEHLSWMIEHDRALRTYLPETSGETTDVKEVVLSGRDLSIAEVVAVAYHRVPVRISQDPTVRSQVDASVEFLRQHLAEDNIVYGINTGYGGSADTRSNNFADMQRALIQHHNSAVLLSSDIGRGTDHSDHLASLKKHDLPRPIVRGSMLARCNSLLRGHSAVRFSVIETIVTLLNKDFIPIVPLRGSISASGDLTPLSYIAGTLEGNSDIFLDCRVAASKDGERVILPANKALARAGLTRIVMDPKEGLGLMNGTAVSCAAGSVALHEAQYLVLASEILTAMCTEALR